MAERLNWTDWYTISCQLQIVIVLLLFNLFFIAFYQLIAMVWTSNTMLKKSAVSDHPTLVSDLRKKLQVLTVEHYVSCELVINGLYYVEVCVFYTRFMESFYHTSMYFVKCLSFFCYADHTSFIFHFVNIAYHLIYWFVNVKPSLNSYDQSHMN